MRSLSKRVLLVAAAVVVAAGIGARSGSGPGAAGSGCSGLCLAAFAAEAGAIGTNAPAKAAVPRLLDLGADKCIPCKMMMPVLAELKTNYTGQLEVGFIDVWKTPEAGKAYKIHLIPTQIFYDAAGKELFRHEGFFSTKEILAKWKELGVELKSEGRSPKAEGNPKGGSAKAEGPESKAQSPKSGTGR